MMLHYIFLFFLGWFHPLHLSISDIVLNPKSGNLEISQRIFIDDLENALRNRTGLPLDLINPKDPALAQELVGDYLKQHFRLQVNGSAVKLHYLGYEVEEDAIWAYMEVPKVRRVSSVHVQHTLFFRQFTDQLNLVNVSIGDQLLSLRLQADEKSGILRFK